MFVVCVVLCCLQCVVVVLAFVGVCGVLSVAVSCRLGLHVVRCVLYVVCRLFVARCLSF